MPMYFMFLTVLSLYVFVRERVDVAVMEVGIGGAFDCTNVIRWVMRPGPAPVLGGTGLSPAGLSCTARPQLF